MYMVKRLSEHHHFLEYASIVGNAYPSYGISSVDDKEKYAENFMKTNNENPFIKFYGIFNEDQMHGGMRLHDFNMNLLSNNIKAGGVGLVAVSFLHKKEKVAKEIITYFINHFNNQGVSMVMLYPFRPDFYKKMGFGFGVSMNQYKVRPEKLPKGTSKANITYLDEDDVVKLLECYTRVYASTNGLIEKYESEFTTLIKNSKYKIVAYKKDEKIEGYMVFEFKSGSDKNPLINDMHINTFVFENRQALEELITFLNSQSDQIRYIIFNTQDENFRFILDDPRNDSDNMFTLVYHETNIQGTGIMYRVINIKGLFNELKNHNFNNETCKIKLTIKDDFVKENNGSIVVNFYKGIASIEDTEGYDVEVFMDIADFSSLITCSVTFKSLYKYGRANISKEEYIDKVNNVFSSGEKPVCMSLF